MALRLPSLFDPISRQLVQWCRSVRGSLSKGRRLGACWVAACFGLLALPGHSIEAPDLDPGETMVIRAEQAWETRAVAADGSKGPRSLHFKGNFRLDAPDWFIRADSATLLGDVDDPRSITVLGTPARVWMVDEAGAKEVDATAAEIEYFRHNDRLKLTGDAVLEEQRNTLRSSSIDYDLNERRLVATGKGGVEIVTMPNRDTAAPATPPSAERTLPPAASSAEQ